MSDKNVFGRIALIVLILAISIFSIWPPKERLKGGIDLVGGTSLLYEIDTSGLEEWQKANLSDRVMSRLKNRVDPQGQRNLVWRPIGQNRLEIQMPRPPEKLAERRQAYERSREALRATRIERTELEAALNLPADARKAALDRLVRGIEARREIFADILEKKAALEKGAATTQATGTRPTSQQAVEMDAAREGYLAGVKKVLDTNVNIEKLGDLLALGKDSQERARQLAEFKKTYPAMTAQIDAMQVAHDAWAATKGPLEDASDLMRLLRGQGVLEFRILAQPDPENSQNLHSTNIAYRDPIEKYTSQLAQYGPRPRPNDNYRWFKVGKPDEFQASNAIVQEYMGEKYVLANDKAPDCALLHDGLWSLKRAIPDRDRMNRPSVSFTLDVRGGVRFEKVTSENLQKPLCILLDNVAMSAPNIQSTIRESGQITGDFTQDDVVALCNTLEAGSLDARLKETPLSIKTVGPSLGEKNRADGVWACQLSILLVVVFMAIYYMYGGVIADIAVMLNLVITLGIMAMIQGTFTLQGIAGLILTLGMAVDANVLIFERVREEQARGISLKMALKLGYERAFWPIFDSNLTSVISAIILGYVGTEEVKGFALTLGLGLCVSMFTALFVTRQFFTILAQSKVSKLETRRCWGGMALLAVAGGVIFGLGYLMQKSSGSHSSIYGFGQFLLVGAGTALVLLLLIWGMRAIAIAAGSHRTNRMPMLSLIKPPNVNWMNMLKVCWPISAVLTLGGLLLFAMQDHEVLLDIEFIGGTSAQITVAPNDPSKPVIDARIEEIVKGEKEKDQAAGWIIWAAGQLENAAQGTGIQKAGEGVFTLAIGDLSLPQMEALLLGQMEDRIVRGGITGTVGNIQVQMKDPATPEEQFKQDILAAARAVRQSAKNINTSARVQSVEDVGASAATVEKKQSFEIVVSETNKKLVGEAVIAALSQQKDFIIQIDRAVGFKLYTDTDLAPSGAFPIRAEHDTLGASIGVPSAEFNVSRYKGGVAMVFDQLNPPQTAHAVTQRLRQMRLQPDYEQYDWRETEVFGLTPTGATAKGADGKEAPTFSKVAIVVNDPNVAVFDNESAWRQSVADPELKLAQAALSSERSLDKVTQFAPQVAEQAAQQAAIALILSLLATIAYLWFRFGTMEYGLGAIIALIHDVAVALGAVSLTHFVAGTAIGNMLMITDMRIDLALVAAFLTIIGFSVNDTIVIFDRIRENRGRLGVLSPQLINDSINQTLPRTILTTFTVILAVTVLYVSGGPGIHSFAFAMMIGCISGTYSTVVLAAPLLYRPTAMRVILAVIVLVTALGMIYGSTSTSLRVMMSIVAIISLALLAYWQYRVRGKAGVAAA